MSGQPQAEWSGPVRDEIADFPVESTVTRFKGHVWDVQTDTVTIGDYNVERDYVAHTGAVAVIALDDQGRVYLLRQYRHPVGMYLFEPPAGSSISMASLPGRRRHGNSPRKRALRHRSGAS